jgi:hypothetical protein
MQSPPGLREQEPVQPLVARALPPAPVLPLAPHRHSNFRQPPRR